MKRKTIAIVPEGAECNDLTIGKEYRIETYAGNVGFSIKDDGGHSLVCLFKRCAHLGGKDWLIK